MPFRYCGGGPSGWQAHTGPGHAQTAPCRQFLFILRYSARPVLQAMRLRLSAVFVWGAVAALALAVAPLLTRNLLAISRHVPLDPNEGWNAAHTLARLAGKGLHPPPQGWMVNNYPPLSFYLVGAIARKSGDIIATGRAISFVAFLLTAVALR